MTRSEKWRGEVEDQPDMAASHSMNTRYLTHADLLHLLKEDPQLRHILQNLLRPSTTEGSAASDPVPQPGRSDPKGKRSTERALQTIHNETDAATRSHVTPAESVSEDRLRGELSSELELLNLVRTDQELSKVWLNGLDEPEGKQLMRVVALAAQWDQVLGLWDRLAERCKSATCGASSDELALLGGCVAVHNLIWFDRQASLQIAETGTEYHYQKHERGTPKGTQIKDVWLPGLVNPAGQLQRKPLVKT